MLLVLVLAVALTALSAYSTVQRRTHAPRRYEEQDLRLSEVQVLLDFSRINVTEVSDWGNSFDERIAAFNRADKATTEATPARISTR
jgi:hypothetical protein